MIARICLVLLLLMSPVVQAAEEAGDPFETGQLSVLNPSKDFQVFLDLAKGGDARAQYILGDTYAKGRVGMVQSDAKARKWFERAAKQGYHAALIRLAAIEKRLGNPVEAYKWYSLAEGRMKGPSADHARAAMRELDLSSAQESEARKLASAWAHGGEAKPDLVAKTGDEEAKPEENKKNEKSAAEKKRAGAGKKPAKDSVKNVKDTDKKEAKKQDKNKEKTVEDPEKKPVARKPGKVNP